MSCVMTPLKSRKAIAKYEQSQILGVLAVVDIINTVSENFCFNGWEGIPQTLWYRAPQCLNPASISMFYESSGKNPASGKSKMADPKLEMLIIIVSSRLENTRFQWLNLCLLSETSGNDVVPNRKWKKSHMAVFKPASYISQLIHKITI